MKKEFKDELLLYPCPVILVTSKHDSIENVFTVSWTGIACSHPEYITISVKKNRFSYDLIKSSGVFTANIIDSDILKAADYCGTVSGRDRDKFSDCSLTKMDGIKINVPMIIECPISIECKVENIIPLGSHDLFISKVISKFINDSIDEKNLHQQLKPVSYFRPDYYTLEKQPLGIFGKMKN